MQKSERVTRIVVKPIANIFATVMCLFTTKKQQRAIVDRLKGISRKINKDAADREFRKDVDEIVHGLLTAPRGTSEYEATKSKLHLMALMDPRWQKIIDMVDDMEERFKDS